MVARAAGQIMALDAASVVSAVTVPTLLIWGSEDDLVPLSLGRQLHASLSGSYLLVLKGSNHFSMFDQPSAFNNALLAFLEGDDMGELYAQDPTRPLQNAE
ncbi:alpha/beta fold hydrolase [Ktedonospora formicarum]|uniref:Peptidase S33 tripeptidyl aminopeptidase-like C-terminal domain-containing protein n=1 Tax=Ktedonospora formicarum TaxID=2778364 RepID=A0A8J3ID63_9CHLR|nr:alpha/beta hydrolase [Ktedonospora formicarum]GHO51030.1 hypothetical protein KSX_91930 [Ktedonospora formicarum]